MKTQEEIIQSFREKFVAPPDRELRAMTLNNEPLIIGTAKEVEQFILQVRTDTINEIRKEVEKMTFRNKGIEVEINNAKGDKATLRDCVFWEDIKTFLNKLDK